MGLYTLPLNWSIILHLIPIEFNLAQTIFIIQSAWSSALTLKKCSSLFLVQIFRTLVPETWHSAFIFSLVISKILMFMNDWEVRRAFSTGIHYPLIFFQISPCRRICWSFWFGFLVIPTSTYVWSFCYIFELLSLFVSFLFVCWFFFWGLSFLIAKFSN